MTLDVMIVVAVLLVLGVGYLIFRLMRRTQAVVPQVTDEDAASRDHVVGDDEHGRDIMASQEAPEAPRDGAAFEASCRTRSTTSGGAADRDDET